MTAKEVLYALVVAIACMFLALTVVLMVSEFVLGCAPPIHPTREVCAELNASRPGSCRCVAGTDYCAREIR
jgi:hypothetical protein